MYEKVKAHVFILETRHDECHGISVESHVSRECFSWRV